MPSHEAGISLEHLGHERADQGSRCCIGTAEPAVGIDSGHEPGREPQAREGVLAIRAASSGNPVMGRCAHERISRPFLGRREAALAPQDADRQEQGQRGLPEIEHQEYQRVGGSQW